MHLTKFAGLTVPDAGESPSVDANSFFSKNPEIIDHFLRIGAISHRHDAHLAGVDPQAPPSASTFSTGGSIPAGTNEFITYTIIDNDGGETRPAEPIVVTTEATVNAPLTAIVGSFDSTTGGLPTGDFAYAITLVDSSGGETGIGPSTFVTRSPGFASGRVLLSNLTGDFLSTGAVSWRLWRAEDGGAFQLISQGSGDTFIDTGLNCTDCVAQPPFDSSATNGANRIQVILPNNIQEPALAASNASAIAIYLSGDGTFGSPSLFGQIPVGSGGQVISVTDLNMDDGSPPDVSTSIQGASQIYPDTDLVWGVKSPVATQAALPGGRRGDVRVTLDTRHIYGVLVASASGPDGWTDLSPEALGDITVAGPGHGSAWVSTSGESFGSGTIADFSIPAGEGAMTVIASATGGLLTTASASQVRFFSVNNDNAAPYSSTGDKYAAQWTKPGPSVAGQKFRAHFITGTIQEDFFPGQIRYGITCPAPQIVSVVVNMTDRQNGLAFWYTPDGGECGWTTDLRLLGTVQQEHGDLSGGQNFGTLEGTRETFMQDGVLREIRVPAGGVAPEGFWLEVYRNGNKVIASIYLQDPSDPATTAPAYTSVHDVTGDPLFGPTVSGYFGITSSELTQKMGVMDLALLSPQATNWVTFPHIREVIFASAGCVTNVTDLGSGAVLVETTTPGASASTTRVASAATEPISQPQSLTWVPGAAEIFVASGASAGQAGYVNVVASAGSAVVTVGFPSAVAGPPGTSGATGATGAAGPQGPTGLTGPPGSNAGSVNLGVGGSAATPLVDPVTYIEFTGSGGVTAGVTGLGGGSARVSFSGGVTLTASGASTPAESTIVASGSAGVRTSVQDQGGGTGVLLIGLPTRDMVVCATPYLASGVASAGASATVYWPLGKTSLALQVQTDVPIRLRLYTSPANRDADVTRATGTDPSPNSGCLLELVTSPANLVYDLSPEVILGSQEGSSLGVMGGQSFIAGSVQNLGNVNGSINVHFVRYLLEA